MTVDEIIEKRRLASEDVAKKQAKLNYMVNMKTTILEQIADELADDFPGLSKTALSGKARQSEDYIQFLQEMRDLDEEVGVAKAQEKMYDQIFWKWQSLNATARAEMGMR